MRLKLAPRPLTTTTTAESSTRVCGMVVHRASAPRHGRYLWWPRRRQDLARCPTTCRASQLPFGSKGELYRCSHSFERCHALHRWHAPLARANTIRGSGAEVDEANGHRPCTCRMRYAPGLANLGTSTAHLVCAYAQPTTPLTQLHTIIRAAWWNAELVQGSPGDSASWYVLGALVPAR